MTNSFLILGGVLLAVVLFFIIATIQIGKYVYKDAKVRGYNAKVWTLFSTIVPYFLGFIGYILMRQIIKSEICHNCNNSIVRTAKFCPNCGIENKKLLENKNDTKELRKIIYLIVSFGIFLIMAMIFAGIYIYTNLELLEFLRNLEDYWEQRLIFS